MIGVMDAPRRDIMAPDTEPTDEELDLVMREVQQVVVARKAATKARMRELLADAVREALSRPRADAAR